MTLQALAPTRTHPLFPLDLPLLEGRLIKRYKRFLADIELAAGGTITAHCPNSGSMATCADPGSPVWVSVSENPKRKLPYTWELVNARGTWVGVNTGTPNAATAHFIERQEIPELMGYTVMKREVKYGELNGSRIDILLDGPSRPPCYVEVKNATMRVGEHAAFPDAVTARGQKHLRELTFLAQEGTRAIMFFFVGRADCVRFRPADEIDPVYGTLLRQAAAAGVELLAYGMAMAPRGVTLLARLPVDL